MVTPDRRAVNHARGQAGCLPCMVGVLAAVIIFVAFVAASLSGALPWQRDKPGAPARWVPATSPSSSVTP